MTSQVEEEPITSEQTSMDVEEMIIVTSSPSAAGSTTDRAVDGITDIKTKRLVLVKNENGSNTDAPISIAEEITDDDGGSEVMTIDDDGAQKSRSLEALFRVTDSELQNFTITEIEQQPNSSVRTISIVNAGGDKIQLISSGADDDNQLQSSSGIRVIYADCDDPNKDGAIDESATDDKKKALKIETALSPTTTNLESKPGRHICPYCSRACAKPSVLQKHIRAHTGERPYPCIPCGFSFKTKSNLYKHCKSRTHTIKVSRHSNRAMSGCTMSELRYMRSIASASGEEYNPEKHDHAVDIDEIPLQSTNNQPVTASSPSETNDNQQQYVSLAGNEVVQVVEVGESGDEQTVLYNLHVPNDGSGPYLVRMNPEEQTHDDDDEQTDTAGNRLLVVDGDEGKTKSDEQQTTSVFLEGEDAARVLMTQIHPSTSSKSMETTATTTTMITPSELLSKRINYLIDKNSAILDTPMADRPRPKRLSRQNSEVKLVETPVIVRGNVESPVIVRGNPGTRDALSKKYIALTEQLNSAPIANVLPPGGDDEDMIVVGGDTSSAESLLLEGAAVPDDGAGSNSSEIKIRFKIPTKPTELTSESKQFHSTLLTTRSPALMTRSPALTTKSPALTIRSPALSSSSKPKLIHPKIIKVKTSPTSSKTSIDELPAPSGSDVVTTMTASPATTTANSPPEWKMILKGKLLMKRSMSAEKMISSTATEQCQKTLLQRAVSVPILPQQLTPCNEKQVSPSDAIIEEFVVADGDAKHKETKVFSTPTKSYLSLIPPQLLTPNTDQISDNNEWLPSRYIDQCVYTSNSAIVSPVLLGNQQLLRLPNLGRDLPPLNLGADTLARFQKTDNDDEIIAMETDDSTAMSQKMENVSRSSSGGDGKMESSTNPTYCTIQGTQPMYVLQSTGKKLSMYSNWRIASHNPNPMGLSSRSMLALYETNKRLDTLNYVNSSPEKDGLLTHSSNWSAAVPQQQQQTDETVTVDDEIVDNMADIAVVESEVVVTTERRSIVKPAVRDLELEIITAATRDEQTADDGVVAATASDADLKTKRARLISIGGFKSEEEYVYIRGRGRGKYVCQQCGIRCRKPSMLKKHVRTHTDFRPYRCKQCHFSFKTKGNLTKHMKSKTHYKRCMEIGVFPVPTAVDDTQIDSDVLEQQIWWSRLGSIVSQDGSHDDDDDDDDDEDDDDSDDAAAAADDDAKDASFSGSTAPIPRLVQTSSFAAQQESTAVAAVTEESTDRPVYVAIQNESTTVAAATRPQYAKIATIDNNPKQQQRFSTIYGYTTKTGSELKNRNQTGHTGGGGEEGGIEAEGVEELSTDREIARSLLDLAKRGDSVKKSSSIPSAAVAVAIQQQNVVIDDNETDEQKGNRLDTLIGALMSRTHPPDAAATTTMSLPTSSYQDNDGPKKVSKRPQQENVSATTGTEYLEKSSPISSVTTETEPALSIFGRRTYAQKIAALQNAYEKDLKSYLSSRHSNSTTSSGFVPPVLSSNNTGEPSSLPVATSSVSVDSMEVSTFTESVESTSSCSATMTALLPVVKQAQSVPTQIRYMSSANVKHGQKRKLSSELNEMGGSKLQRVDSKLQRNDSEKIHSDRIDSKSIGTDSNSKGNDSSIEMTIDSSSETPQSQTLMLAMVKGQPVLMLAPAASSMNASAGVTQSRPLVTPTESSIKLNVVMPKTTPAPSTSNRKRQKPQSLGRSVSSSGVGVQNPSAALSVGGRTPSAAPTVGARTPSAAPTVGARTPSAAPTVLLAAASAPVVRPIAPHSGEIKRSISVPTMMRLSSSPGGSTCSPSGTSIIHATSQKLACGSNVITIPLSTNVAAGGAAGVTPISLNLTPTRANSVPNSKSSQAVSSLGVLNSKSSQVVLSPGVLNAKSSQAVLSPCVLNSKSSQVVSSPGVLNSKSSQAVLSPGVLNSKSSQAVLSPGVLNSKNSQAVLSPGVLNSKSSQVVLSPGVLNAKSSQAVLSPGVLNSKSSQAILNPGVLNSKSSQAVLSPGVLNSKISQAVLNSGSVSNSKSSNAKAPIVPQVGIAFLSSGVPVLLQTGSYVSSAPISDTVAPSRGGSETTVPSVQWLPKTRDLKQPLPAQGYVEDLSPTSKSFVVNQLSKQQQQQLQKSISTAAEESDTEQVSPGDDKQSTTKKPVAQQPLSTATITKPVTQQPSSTATSSNNIKYVEGENSAPFEIVPIPGKVEDNSKSLKDGKYVCHICDKSFNQEHQLSLHKNIHFFERPYRCVECSISFRTYGLLQRHRRSEIHATKATVNMQYGVPTTDNPRPYRCDTCDMGFRIYGHLAKHLRSKLHVTKESNPDDVDRQTDISIPPDDNTIFRCADCKVDFTVFTSYTRHLQSKQHASNATSPATKETVIGGADSSEDGGESDSSLDGAIAMSPEEAARLYKCDCCNTAYREREQLDKHLRSRLHSETIEKLGQIEEGEGQIEADEGRIEADEGRIEADEGQSEADDGENLEINNDVSTEIQSELVEGAGESSRQKCGLCGVSFSSIDQLKQHLASHAELRPYVCKFCDAGFTNAPSLRSHLRIHEQELKFTCGHCGVAFFSSESLKNHLQQQHQQS
ncbi:uncharacterized protein LOC141910405 [Tubulanus polymorphus]|uniref:uncharacterized protein LOC141910405 n=1 Tax=Tubulanus polymorphus TaxID=672921 RepID=UPI003DA47777